MDRLSLLRAVSLTLLLGPSAGLPAVVDNLTGLPAYPNLSSAAMEAVFRTETLGRQCSRFIGATPDALPVVEAWYRKALVRASETDLSNDEQYQRYASLVGIKLALGLDYVAVYRFASQPTIIELHRCTWL
jgi:hypothetical protein